MEQEPRDLGEGSRGRGVEGSSSQWVDLCSLDELDVGHGRHIASAGRHLAVFRLPSGKVAVLDHACPHAGGPQASGHVSGPPGHETVTCPWHAFTFRLDNGRLTDSAYLAVPTYATKIQNGRVLADLSHPQPLPPIPPEEPP